MSAPDARQEARPALSAVTCSACGAVAHLGRPCPDEVWEDDTVKIEPDDPLYPIPAQGGAR